MPNDQVSSSPDSTERATRAAVQAAKTSVEKEVVDLIQEQRGKE